MSVKHTVNEDDNFWLGTITEFCSIQPYKAVDPDLKIRMIKLVQGLKVKLGIAKSTALSALGLHASRYYRWEDEWKRGVLVASGSNSDGHGKVEECGFSSKVAANYGSMASGDKPSMEVVQTTEVTDMDSGTGIDSVLAKESGSDTDKAHGTGLPTTIVFGLDSSEEREKCARIGRAAPDRDYANKDLDARYALQLNECLESYTNLDFNRLRALLKYQYGICVAPKKLRDLLTTSANSKKIKARPVHRRVAVNKAAGKELNQLWFRYPCFIKLEGIMADFPLCIFIDSATKAIVHYELDMSWPTWGVDGLSIKARDLVKQKRFSPPKVVGDSGYWYLVNEFEYFLSCRGVVLSREWSFGQALHKRTGRMAGWDTLTSAKHTLRENLADVQKLMAELVYGYNHYWPVLSNKLTPPIAV